MLQRGRAPAQSAPRMTPAVSRAMAEAGVRPGVRPLPLALIHPQPPDAPPLLAPAPAPPAAPAAVLRCTVLSTRAGSQGSAICLLRGQERARVFWGAPHHIRGNRGGGIAHHPVEGATAPASAAGPATGKPFPQMPLNTPLFQNSRHVSRAARDSLEIVPANQSPSCLNAVDQALSLSPFASPCLRQPLRTRYRAGVTPPSPPSTRPRRAGWRSAAFAVDSAAPGWVAQCTASPSPRRPSNFRRVHWDRRWTPLAAAITGVPAAAGVPRRSARRCWSPPSLPWPPPRGWAPPPPPRPSPCLVPGGGTPLAPLSRS